MRETDNKTLESIKTGIWTICGILLIWFGFEYTDISKTELGDLIAVIALIAGAIVFCYAFYKIGERLFLKIKDIADEEDRKNKS